MPLRGIIAGLGLAFVALGWWRVLQRRAWATGTVTRRLRREHDHTGTEPIEITFEVEGREFRFHPSVVTNFDVGKLAVGVKVAVATIRTIRRARTSRSRGASIRDRSWSR
jgi:hypothetical protein